MKIIDGLENIDDQLKAVSLTIGNFDGVHLGHQRLLERTVELGRQENIPSVAMTFSKHPVTVLDHASKPCAVAPLARRIELIEQLGIEFLIMLPCDRRILDLTAQQFTQQVIVGALGARFVVEGSSFRFGRGRAGDIDYLRSVEKQFGFQAIEVDQVVLDLSNYGRCPVSSTLVRQLIRQGRVELVGKCLGRYFELAGSVIEGKARGRRLGFPTANIEPPDQMLPGHGIYAAWAYVDRQAGPIPAAVYIGGAPTFDDQDVQVEAFLMGFDGDLYDRQMRLELVAFLRGPMRFESDSQLTKQIDADCEQIRRILDR